MRHTGILMLTGLFIATSALVALPPSMARAKDTIEVVKDKDKTAYVIDSDDEYRREEERDKENAWKMLQNSNIWIGGGRRNPVDPGTTSAK